jgi:hypothetical protein
LFCLPSHHITSLHIQKEKKKKTSAFACLCVLVVDPAVQRASPHFPLINIAGRDAKRFILSQPTIQARLQNHDLQSQNFTVFLK